MDDGAEKADARALGGEDLGAVGIADEDDGVVAHHGGAAQGEDATQPEADGGDEQEGKRGDDAALLEREAAGEHGVGDEQRAQGGAENREQVLARVIEGKEIGARGIAVDEREAEKHEPGGNEQGPGQQGAEVHDAAKQRDGVEGHENAREIADNQGGGKASAGFHRATSRLGRRVIKT